MFSVLNSNQNAERDFLGLLEGHFGHLYDRKGKAGEKVTPDASLR